MKAPLGQNFLNDQRVLHKIVEAGTFTPQDTIVEIGPGKGSLTRLLAARLKTLYAVEYDRNLLPALHAEFDGGPVHIIHADFLNWDFKGVPAPVKIVGNIPYYISTPIIEHLLEHRAHITEAFLTVQKEFGERLAARPGGKDYGSLSCFVQYYAEVKVLFKIKNTCFTPPPKVDSCFVHLAFHPKAIYHPKDEPKMFTMIRTAFTQRRKTIVNALSPLADKERLSAVLTRLDLSPKARPETLSLQNYVDISDLLC
ncbi:MAG: 16S rRNA (adenine(1518)-N(6)/adenine(1519)-N(6))-dimethyltransferase RsmA [Candidatus Omnitrophota bacterium]|nr:16S rRNA (adenine(1518)-N(6)/adenine(1519)-N(6))-dimethyltransferase RsmA [Candidatus Omnitrophota bacterium]